MILFQCTKCGHEMPCKNPLTAPLLVPGAQADVCATHSMIEIGVAV